ncbi:MAG: hypothetical protein MJE68_21070, partial [Proteobacteria bacterium]|nr:hypothetical protein [Pseudomonadota bacterium]
SQSLSTSITDVFMPETVYKIKYELCDYLITTYSYSIYYWYYQMHHRMEVCYIGEKFHQYRHLLSMAKN